MIDWYKVVFMNNMKFEILLLLPKNIHIINIACILGPIRLIV
jgi:hypothetical protein